jgi:hypothetical protein
MPLICSICGDVARGMNFDVITCMSCKAFFRRHASQATVSDIVKSYFFYTIKIEKCLLSIG